MKMANSSRRASCGLDFCSVPDIRGSLQGASEAGYDFTCFPIVHPRFKREFISGKSKERPGAFTRSDLILAGSDWNNLIVGKLSPYIDVDSEDPVVRKESEEALNQELAYASHLGLPAVMFTLRRDNQTNLARILHNKMQAGSTYQIWLHLPMESPAIAASYYHSDEEDFRRLHGGSEMNTWEWWNKFRSVCNFEKRLGLALEVTPDIPSDEEVARWMGEPIKCLVLSTTLFATNKKGYPVLLRPHQNLIKSLATLDVQVVIRGAIMHGCSKYYQQYLDHLWQNTSHTDPLVAYARGYEDYLQCPLQPLMDNLESQTYEVFEKDPVKYNEYQRAIYGALLDMIMYEEKDSKVAVVMVVGAGRGPLVRAALNAAQKADRKIKVYAVEKNPNAVVTLQAQQEEFWGDQVTVVSCDMRDWNSPEKADILVSELLGSFGDNELSPECLDGAQKFLKDDGISIPCSYTSYLCPVQSSKLYNEVRLCKEKDKHALNHFETPYVVHLQNRFQLAPTQPLFTFFHPNKDAVRDNTRYKCLSFKISQNCVLHGFSGYFDTVLYKNIILSIVPETHSRGMFSWFPIFFPIREPLQLRSGDELEVHFWRLCSKKNVWYEWSITKPIPVPVHNPNGRSYTIGL
ncbi:Protein arginine N-methyltransferase 5 [Cryptotermes secundus]|uniref:Protein arginine N-methyltransferase n=1 Tax=Cryptotermes secundus TaxID=105785 RepID=A0A2J7RP49_9NEOP|nr:protein arginine N-methyltransferase 5 [Cryptotermes secundus]XP_023711957.1 protein arginine N-methyltransferase 5 [Cryptotermes secundus]XP_023711963.1 protein arginine N-methyltransferase 5 [Cryptotermes secundus]XP_033608359.1 protein arginine N-methyltransferase 5 [Cryptotermes secundus]PNF42601.1 Protein arginine N-methyltransferase 5 [Cryptotermes secundus]PNF42602.1 Protein arginine N-methyltransferase 5 [Cryptotermes secundus]